MKKSKKLKDFKFNDVYESEKEKFFDCCQSDEDFFESTNKNN